MTLLRVHQKLVDEVIRKLALNLVGTIIFMGLINESFLSNLLSRVIMASKFGNQIVVTTTLRKQYMALMAKL